jgi:hypothetical protein
MSASSHTREHRYAAEYTASILAWLEGHDRKVINTSRALQLEVSKVLQYASLNAHKIRTPRIVAAKSPDSFITRCEFIGGKFIYAVQVDTSNGFQLCPADVCQIGDAFCPVGVTQKPKFKIIEGFTNPILDKYARFLKANNIHIAGIEFITDEQGGNLYLRYKYQHKL